MMQKIIIICFGLAFAVNVFASDNYSIYLVRHAEKLTDSKNPSLTACGEKRAIQIIGLPHSLKSEVI